MTEHALTIFIHVMQIDHNELGQYMKINKIKQQIDVFIYSIPKKNYWLNN